MIRLSDNLGLDNCNAVLQAGPPEAQDRDGKRTQEVTKDQGLLSRSSC